MTIEGSPTPISAPDAGTATGTNASAAPDASSTPTPEAPPAWFTAYAEQQAAAISKLERTIGGQLGQLRGKKTTFASDASPTQTEPSAASEPPPGPTHADLAAAMSLGQLTQNLPDAVRAEVMQRAGEGDFQGAVAMAEMAAKVASALAATKPAEAPRAHQGTPSTGSGNYPKTTAEWVEIGRKDPARFERLAKDPGFDPTKLG